MGMINESMINEIVSRATKTALREYVEQFNIKNVYHVSAEMFDEFKIVNFPYFFFSSKPITINGNKHTYICNLSMHKPMIFDGGMSWSYPLWLFLSTGDGRLIPEEEFTREKFNGYLGCPYELWEMVYYDEDEYEIDQLPQLVQSLNMGYDGVIMKNIDEGNTSINVDDYVVFDKNQIQIVSRI